MNVESVKHGLEKEELNVESITKDWKRYDINIESTWQEYDIRVLQSLEKFE